MRRGLLTARAVVPITVGNVGVHGTTAAAAEYVYINLDDPANASGTLTSAVFQRAATVGSTVYVMVGTIAGSVFTVRSISSELSASVGTNTFTVSLPIQAGDYIGVWTPVGATGARGCYGLVGGKSFGYNATAPTTVPSAGAALGFNTVDGAQLALGGHG